MAGTLYVAGDESNRGQDPEYYAVTFSTDPNSKKMVEYVPFLAENPDLVNQVITSNRIDYRYFSARKGQIEERLALAGIEKHPDDFKLSFAVAHLLAGYLRDNSRRRYTGIELFLDGDLSEEARKYLGKRVKALPRFKGRASVRSFPKGSGEKRESCQQPNLLIYAHAIVGHVRCKDAPLFVRP